MLRSAWARRAGLLDADTDCVRLLCEEEPPRGVAIDLFADVAVVQARAEVETAPLVAALLELGPVRTVYVRSVGVAGAEVPAAPAAGSPVERLEVVENGVRFLIEPASTSVGLFLDARDNRRRVRELASGRRVLNTFAHTCGFSVCAGLGGAVEVVSVDAARRYLDWGRANWALNPIDAAIEHVTLCDDVIAAVERAERNQRSYDLIILDPPTFGRSKRGRWQIKRDLGRLFRATVAVAAPQALVFLCTNHRGTSLSDLEAEFAAAASARPFEVVERPSLPLDFTASPGYAKSVWIRLGS